MQTLILFQNFLTEERKKYISWIFGILLLSLFVIWFDRNYAWSSLMHLWQKLSPQDGFIILTLMLLSYLIRSIRVYTFFIEHKKSDFLTFLRTTLLHNFFNVFLPMRSGAITFPIMLKRYLNIDPVQSSALLVWFLFLDLQLLLLLVMFFILHGSVHILILIGLIIAVYNIPYLIFRLRIYITRKEVFRKSKFLSRLITGIPRTSSQFWITFFWTTLNWPIKLLAYGWLLSRIILIPLMDGIWASLTGDLGSIIPLQGLAGFGTYEAGVIFGLTGKGIAMESSVLGAINLHLFILSSSVLSVIFAFIINKPGLIKLRLLSPTRL